jgi:glycine hydroxymethyltransferase
MDKLHTVDPTINQLISDEQLRIDKTINLIASENYCPRAIRETVGSVFTNKYAEGYPKRRYYGGCQIVDDAETIAIERCKELFMAEHANVQPHSGSQANAAAYFAVLKPGDTILAMSLTSGGHLTHGHALNFSGSLYNIVSYNVDPSTNEIDYEMVHQLAQQYKPKIIVAGASAYPRFINFAQFRVIADSVGALLMVDMAHIAGLVAANLHPSPVPYADIVTSTTHKTLRGPRGGFILCKKELASSIDRAVMPGMQGGPFMNVIAAKAVNFHLAMQPEFIEYQQQIIKNAQTLAQALIKGGHKLITNGTDNHLMLIDVRPHNITGKEAEERAATTGIYVNRNTIPYDPQKPFIASGIRIGTPAVTSRGFTEEHMEMIANWLDEILRSPQDTALHAIISNQVQELCNRFPYNKEL